jgi:hypothetical protein
MSRSLFRLGAGQGQLTGMFLAGCIKRFATSRIEEKNQGRTPTRIEIGVTITRPSASRVTCQAFRMRAYGAVVPSATLCDGQAGRQKSVRSADASMQRRALALRNSRLPTTGLTILRFSLLRILPFNSPAHLQDGCGLHLVEVFPYGGSASPTPSGITSGTILVLQPLGYFVA